MTSQHKIAICLQNRPLIPYTNSGDMPLYYQWQNSLLLVLIDGVGHGVSAHLAAVQAKAFLDANHQHFSIEELLSNLHTALEGSVGAAIGMAYIDLQEHSVSFASIGNIRCALFGATRHLFYFTDGVVGQRFRTPSVQEHLLNSQDKLVLYSDGIYERFYDEVVDNSRILTCDEFADLIIRDFGKDQDDASCLVYKYENLGAN